MSYADFAAAELEAPVLVETYVQAHQSWWDGKVTVYAVSPDGAYFIYNMACDEADAEKLIPGQKIRVSGFKGEWAGEIEIVDATFELVDDDPFVAKTIDVTGLLDKDELIDFQNQFVSFKGMTVEAYDESGAAFAYKDPEGKSDDLYFKVSKDGQTYDFCVEFYLCGKDSEVYKQVEALQVGDVVDLEGFLYWYNGANPHITSVKPPLPVMSYADYAAAALEEPVVIATYVQAHQSWWNDQITVYTQDKDGAYFLYNMACSEAEAEKLVPGQKILVSGFKGEWAGEIEVTDATFELAYGDTFVAEPVDATDLLGSDKLIERQNQLVTFKGMTVEAYDESGAAFAYKDPEGKTDDLYFKVSKDGKTYEFCVEFYLCGKDTEVYKAVEGLQVGDVVDLTGFLYWYNGANLHTTAVSK